MFTSSTPNKKLRAKINELFNFAFDLKEQGHDLFIDYAPHVNSLSIRLHINGWYTNKYPNYAQILYFDVWPKFTPDSCTKMINEIKEIINNNKEVDYGDK